MTRASANGNYTGKSIPGETRNFDLLASTWRNHLTFSLLHQSHLQYLMQRSPQNFLASPGKSTLCLLCPPEITWYYLWCNSLVEGATYALSCRLTFWSSRPPVIYQFCDFGFQERQIFWNCSRQWNWCTVVGLSLVVPTYPSLVGTPFDTIIGKGCYGSPSSFVV